MQKAIELIKHFESLHDGDLTEIGLQPKLCPADIWTIAWGRAVVDPVTGKHLKGKEGKARALELYLALTIEQADDMLDEDYAVFEKGVKKLLFRTPTDFELGAMTCLAYNIGLGSPKRPKGFYSSSVLRYFNGGNKPAAADSFLMWNKAGGKVLPGLSRRRRAERHLFLFNGLKFKF